MPLESYCLSIWNDIIYKHLATYIITLNQRQNFLRKPKQGQTEQAKRKPEQGGKRDTIIFIHKKKSTKNIAVS